MDARLISENRSQSSHKTIPLTTHIVGAVHVHLVVDHFRQVEFQIRPRRFRAPLNAVKCPVG